MRPHPRRDDDRDPADIVSGVSSLQASIAPVFREMDVWKGPVPPLPWWSRSRSPLPSNPPFVGRVRRCVHRTSRKSSSVRGAAGSRTRVPRSRSSGLYVRRSWMISDAVLQGQTASASLPSQIVPRTLNGRSPEVEPRDVDPTPLRGVRGGSSQVFRLRGPGHCPWHLWFPTRDYRGRVSTLGTLPWQRTDHGRNRISPRNGVVKWRDRRSAVVNRLDEPGRSV